MHESDWYEVEKKLTHLAFLDEADSYEVDQCLIGIDPTTGKFILMTASGCSCWDGYATVEEFDSLDALESSLINEDRTYNPSLNGAKSLMQEAREAHAR